MVCSHCILIPKGSTGSSTFLMSNESPNCSHYNPKFQLQIHCILKVIADNVPISGVIPILIFLCIFKIALTPVSHTYFCPRRERKKSPWSKIVPNVSYGSRSISLQWKIHMSKWAHPTLKVISKTSVDSDITFKR